ncbi:glycosyl transferase family 1 [Salipaludibacillus keqinensis]|uniref:Glycosyl transferase family 1 n=1 Tax=Salipaludibacillus keqinensis TaxID=2045207 RepID=A0A323TKF8_9BACI|nr:glycosyltransferase [Salipaludibacillus keqinensis]PYZ95070.1 glycosyl transferase family 1 [Salipaludibacillus keqinensis]
MGGPIRVLHAVVNMNRGGAETFLMNLYRHIDRSKVQFDFLTSKEGVFDQEIKKLGGVIHRIPYLTEVGPKKYRQLLDKFFNDHPLYKIIHSHMDKMSGMILTSAKNNNVPIRIAHSHNTSSEGNGLVQLYKWHIGNKLNEAATDRFACSMQAGEWLFKDKKKTFFLINNSIDVDAYLFNRRNRLKVRKELGLNGNNLVLGQIGRFNHQKNHLFSLQLFSQVIKRNKQARLVLVGDGSERDRIERRIRKLNLDEFVILTGVRSDIPEVLSALDLLLFPSFHEGMPVALIEAQTSGLTCLASETITPDVDLNLNLVQFLSLKNQKSWLDEIARFDRTQPNRFNQRSSLTSKGFDITTTANELENFYINKIGGVVPLEEANNLHAHV